MPTDTNNDDDHRTETDHDVTRDDYHDALDANVEDFAEAADAVLGESAVHTLSIDLQGGTTIYLRLYANANGVSLADATAACEQWHESLDATDRAALDATASRADDPAEIPSDVDVNPADALWLGLSPTDAAATRRAEP